MPFHEEEHNVTSAIKETLAGRDDLLNYVPDNDHPLAGHCYVASEVLFHLSGGYDRWYVERVSMGGDVTHWYLRERETNHVVDLTAEQFDREIPYDEGTRTGFLTDHPSKRARTVIEELKWSLA